MIENSDSASDCITNRNWKKPNRTALLDNDCSVDSPVICVGISDKHLCKD